MGLLVQNDGGPYSLMNKITLYKNREYTISDNFITLLILFYFTLNLMISFFNMSRRTNTYLCLVVSFFAVVVAIIRKDKVNLLGTEILFYGTIVVLHSISIIYNHNFSYSSILLVMRHFFIAMALARTKINKKLISIAFWVLVGYFVYLLVTGYYTGGVGRSISQNAISIYLVLFLALHFLANQEVFDLNSWMMVGVSMILTIWTGSRGGIISIATLIIGMIICERKKINFRHLRIKILLGIGIGILITLLGIWYIDKKVGLDYYLLLLRRSRESLRDNVRFRIIAEYIEATKTSFGSLLFGVKLGTTSLIGILEGNPHNSYIYAHANFGIVYLILILFLLMRACKNYFTKKDLLLYVLICIALRSFSDIPAFPGIYDALFYYLIFEKSFDIFQKQEGKI